MKRTPTGFELGEAASKGLMRRGTADPRRGSLPRARVPYKGGAIGPG